MSPPVCSVCPEHLIRDKHVTGVTSPDLGDAASFAKCSNRMSQAWGMVRTPEAPERELRLGVTCPQCVRQSRAGDPNYVPLHPQMGE